MSDVKAISVVLVSAIVLMACLYMIVHLLSLVFTWSDILLWLEDLLNTIAFGSIIILVIIWIVTFMVIFINEVIPLLWTL